MSESQLQIVISVINNAAGQLADVGTQLATLGTEAAASASDMSASMAGAATSIEGSLNAAELAAVSAAEASLSQWAGTASGISGDMASAAAAVADEYSGMGNSAELAAAAANEAWQASLDELTSKMALVGGAVDADFAGMATTAEASVTKLQSSVSSLGGKAMSTGFMAGIAGALGLDVIKNAVSDASDDMNSLAQMGQSVQASFTNAGTGASGAATEIKTLTDQINSLKASQDVAEAALQKYTGTTVQVAASHAKASAEIATYQDQINKLTGKLTELQNGNGLTAGGADQVTASLTAAANSAVGMGFSISDSAQALTTLWSNTQNTTQAQQAFQDAMDLSRRASIPLTQAANDVVQAMQGNGKALRDVNVQVQDGLSGQQALAAIMQQVGGSAATYASGPLGQLDIATAQLNATMAAAGKTIVPVLTDLTHGLDGFLKDIDAFVTAHPKVTEGLLLIWGGLSLTLVVLAPFLISFGALVQFFELINTLKKIEIFSTAAGDLTTLGKVLTTDVTPAFTAVWTFLTETIPAALTGFASLITDTVIPACVEWAAAELLPILPWILVGLAIAALVALVILYHQQILQAIEKAWDSVKTAVSAATDWLTKLFTGWGNDTTKWWGDLWNGIYTTLEGVWGKIQTVINNILSAVSKVTGAVSSIGGGVAGAVGGAVSSVFSSITHVQDAIITPSGQVIQTDVADYLFATKNPGAIAGAGGGGGITINIQGGNYLDSQGANMIAAALARQIQQQIRMRNYT